jgi:hypothetical protein
MAETKHEDRKEAKAADATAKMQQAEAERKAKRKADRRKAVEKAGGVMRRETEPYKPNVPKAGSVRHPMQGSHSATDDDSPLEAPGDGPAPVYSKPYGSEPRTQPAVSYTDESKQRRRA